MRFFRRSLIALGVAATLPTVLLASAGIFHFLRTERAQVETETLGRSANVVNLSDAALRGDLRALNVLSTSELFASRNWREFYARVKRALETNPHWQTIHLFDADAGEEIFDVSKRLGVPRPAPLPGTESIESLRRAGGPVVGGVTIQTEPVIYLYLPIQQEHARYVLAAAVRAQVFQDILLSQVPAGATASAGGSLRQFRGANARLQESRR